MLCNQGSSTEEHSGSRSAQALVIIIIEHGEARFQLNSYRFNKLPPCKPISSEIKAIGGNIQL